jgi:TolB-like protein/class 3 adenylate cyclase
MDSLRCKTRTSADHKISRCSSRFFVFIAEARMSANSSPNPKFEIGHVLFIDVVGYSKLLINEQSELLRKLNEIVRRTEQFRLGETEGELVRLPTGDGMALVFRNSPESPVQCALEISQALKDHPKIQVRMGIHSGPVNEVVDVNERGNLAGAGINIAQRVMGCGDAGHILLSRHVAEDLEAYARWRPYLHDLGECEVKHGVRIGIVNLHNNAVGNRRLPEKIRKGRVESDKAARVRKRQLMVALLLVLIAVGAFFVIYRNRTLRPFAVIPAKSIAVLPFQNLSASPENAFFADGVQDEILTDLARVADLKVISRTSVMQYKAGLARNAHAIGQALGVAHLLEGSVQRAGSKVRVNAQLIDARNDTHLWAQTYDRDLADIFAIQSEIAKTIADQLQAKLSPSEKAAIESPPTRDLTAYDLYVQAQALSAHASDPIQAKEKLPQSVILLDQAVARDPNFIRARCLLSRVHGQMYWAGFDHTPGRLALAKAEVEAALRIQPSAGEVHLALADYYYHGFRDYKRARSELAIAQRTLPNNAQLFEYTGYIDRREGHWEKATHDLERALELDPRNFQTIQQLALTYQPQRRYQDELRTYDRALTIVPNDPSTLILRAWVPADWQADLKPFQATLAALLAKDPASGPDLDDINYALCERTSAAVERALRNYPPGGAVYNGVTYPRTYWEGVIARWQGDQENARAAFSAARHDVQQLLAKQSNFAAALSLLGLIDAGLEQKEDAVDEGRRACELLPISADAVDGVAYAVSLAQIYTWSGEKDLAIDQIAAVERAPNYLSYGFLKLQPVWDPLRGDPRFEKIVASLAPKD